MCPDAGLGDDAVALRITRNRTTGRGPFVRMTRPYCRIAHSGLQVDGVPGSEDRDVLACESLRLTDVTDPAVAVLVVIPVLERESHERLLPWKALSAQFISCQLRNSVQLNRGRLFARY